MVQICWQAALAQRSTRLPPAPPLQQDLQDVNSLLNTVVRGAVAARAGLPSWLQPLVPNLAPLLDYSLEFAHHGAQLGFAVVEPLLNRSQACWPCTFLSGLNGPVGR